MKYNITNSAKIVGVGRNTFYRHLQDKKISYELDGKTKMFDAAELIRVYGNDKCDFSKVDGAGAEQSNERSDTRVNTSNTARADLALVTLEKELIQAERDRLLDQLADAQKALDKAQDQANRLLIEYTPNLENTPQALEQKMKDLEQRILAKQDADTAKELRRYKQALAVERNKSPWEKIFGKRRSS